MRLIYGWCAATLFVTAASAQSPVHLPMVSAPILPANFASQVSSTRLAVTPRDSQPLSRRDVISESLAHNAQLEIALEQTAEARARKVTATSIPDPAVTAGYSGISSPFHFGGAPSTPASVALDIPFPDKFRLNNKVGIADIHAREFNFRLQQQSIAVQASATYDSLLAARMHRQNLRDSRDLAADFLKKTETRFNAGTAAKLDAIQAQVSLAQANNALIANEADIANAQASLNRIMGRTTSAAIVPTDSLGMPIDLPDSSSIERVATLNRPELAIVQQQRTGAKYTTRLAKEFWLPDITFAAGRDYSVPGTSPLFTTGLAFPLPIFYWQHAKGDIAQAAHFERELAATERDTRAAIIQDVRIAYANANTAMRQVRFLRDELLPAANDAYRIASSSYAIGGSSALEVLSARSALLQSQSQYIDALSAANTARAGLERALGTSVAVSPVTTSGANNR
jgi:cobalt-zinc-cadmium efflux system outer membrane protein